MASVAHVGDAQEVEAMVARQVDLFKSRQITFTFTTLTASTEQATSSVGVSSLTDTWLELRNVEQDGERNRLLYVIKSRGMAHSNQVREFLLTSRGAQLMDVEVGPKGVITGSGREHEKIRRAEWQASREAEIERRRRTLLSRRAAVEAQIHSLRAQMESETADFEAELALDERREGQEEAGRLEMAQRREAN